MKPEDQLYSLEFGKKLKEIGTLIDNFAKMLIQLFENGKVKP